MAIISAVIYPVVTEADVGIYRNADVVYKKQYFISLIFNRLSVLPYLFGGIITLICGGEGIYWMIPGILLSFIKAEIDAWALSVEINR